MNGEIFFRKPFVLANFNIEVVIDTSKYFYFWGYNILENNWSRISERSTSKIEFDGSVYQSFEFKISEWINNYDCATKNEPIELFFENIWTYTKLGLHTFSSTLTHSDTCEDDHFETSFTDEYSRKILIKYYNLDE